jgi:hypothetical protein
MCSAASETRSGERCLGPVPSRQSRSHTAPTTRNTCAAMRLAEWMPTRRRAARETPEAATVSAIPIQGSDRSAAHFPLGTAKERTRRAAAPG